MDLKSRHVCPLVMIKLKLKLKNLSLVLGCKFYKFGTCFAFNIVFNTAIAMSDSIEEYFDVVYDASNRRAQGTCKKCGTVVHCKQTSNYIHHIETKHHIPIYKRKTPEVTSSILQSPSDSSSSALARTFSSSSELSSRTRGPSTA